MDISESNLEDRRKMGKPKVAEGVEMLHEG
jgi:hypothetical protein